MAFGLLNQLSMKWILIFLLFSVFSQAEEPAICRLLLTSVVLKIYDKDVNNLILESPQDIETFIKKNPSSPWKNELHSLPALNQIIYISEYGPTLWNKNEYVQWQKLSQQASDVSIAREMIESMSRGKTVAGFSKDVHTRLRNGFLAYMEGFSFQMVDLTQRMASLDQTSLTASEQLEMRRKLIGNEARHPHQQRQAEFFDRMTGIDQPPKKTFLNFDFGLSSYHEVEQMGIEMRTFTPSLRLPFKPSLKSFQKNQTIEGAQTIEADYDVKRIIKMLLDISLVRRRLFTGQTLETLLHNEDQLYFLSAFPELLPFWRETLHWPDTIRNQDLTELENFFSPALGIISHKKTHDILSLVLGRAVDDDGSLPFAELEFNIKTSEGNAEWYDQNDFDRIQNFLNKHLPRFYATFGIDPRSDHFQTNLTEDRMKLESRSPEEAAILTAFYMYLKQKFLVVPFADDL